MAMTSKIIRSVKEKNRLHRKMDRIIFRKTDVGTHPVDKAIFEKITGKKPPFYSEDGGGTAFAICPRCHNPAKLFGIYRKLENQKPHARHFKNDVPDLADYDELKFRKCPNHRKKGDYVFERRPGDATETDLARYRLARDYFDYAVHLVQDAIGMKVSYNLARQMATDYYRRSVFMYVDADNGNIPWFLIHGISSIAMYGRVIQKGGILYDFLDSYANISLTEDDPEKPNGYLKVGRKGRNVFVALTFKVVNVRFETVGEKFKEYITVNLSEPAPDHSGTYETVFQQDVEVSPNLFTDMIANGQEERDPYYIRIAKEYMPEL